MPLLDGGIGEKNAIRMSADASSMLNLPIASGTWISSGVRVGILGEEQVRRHFGCWPFDRRGQLVGFRRFASDRQLAGFRRTGLARSMPPP